MSGEAYYFCEDCFSQWCVDGFDNIDPTQCLECGGTNIGGGDLGKEGTMVSELMDMVRDCEYSLYHEDLSEYTDLLRKMTHKYFELDKDFEDPEDVLERMEETYDNCD